MRRLRKEMSMIAYCGLHCEKCSAFLATLHNDDDLRAKVAKEWSEMYLIPVKAEDINCTGCRSDGVKSQYCERLCRIRLCAQGREVQTCADCDWFPCEHLNEVFRFAPQAKVLLEALRKESPSEES
jgi:hypothetical protein